MIDIEPIVFEAVKNAVSPVKCSPTYQDRSKVFPLVTVEEHDNSVYEKTQDSGNIENHARVLYDVNVYSNLASGKKAQAKQLIHKVDEVMANFGFDILLHLIFLAAYGADYIPLFANFAHREYRNN